MLAVISVIAAVLWLLTLSTPFCDWYTLHIFPLLSTLTGRLSSLVPFVIAEWMQVLDYVLIGVTALLIILLIFLRKKQGFRKFAGHWYKSLLMTLSAFLLLFTATWFVPFRASVLLEGDRSDQPTSFSFDEVRELMETCVSVGNQAAEEMEIGADGKAVFLSEAALHDSVTRALQGLSGDYTLLSGYYPPVKNALCSDILERMWIGGYTYPFTAESTRNKYCSPIWQTVTDAHELCHHKGYFLENEANFLSAVALMESDEPQLRMAGARAVLDSVTEFYDDLYEERLNEALASGIITPPQFDESTTEEEFLAFRETVWALVGPDMFEFSERFYQICANSQEIYTEIYEADAHPIDNMPAVDNAIQQTADIGWETQAAVLKENCYDGDTLLILQYFAKRQNTESFAMCDYMQPKASAKYTKILSQLNLF